MLAAPAPPSNRNRRLAAVCMGRGAAWSAHLLWEQGVAGSNPAVPTTSTNPLLSRGADGPSLGQPEPAARSQPLHDTPNVRNHAGHTAHTHGRSAVARAPAGPQPKLPPHAGS